MTQDTHTTAETHSSKKEPQETPMNAAHSTSNNSAVRTQLSELQKLGAKTLSRWESRFIQDMTYRIAANKPITSSMMDAVTTLYLKVTSHIGNNNGNTGFNTI